MVVGALELHLRLEGVGSLKEKRAIVRSLVDRLRRRFCASVAEVGDHDLWGNAAIGVAVVGADVRTVESVLSQVVEVLDSDPRFEASVARREVSVV
ncbi:MAG: DUF503 domain-containing protein [Fimbriimonas ginsengisoli]|uniref:DUF503 domain-containing protein n=1 Tax=Fimbriimonas ginsengisoli TaxID=1005039 RepID=A0A931PVY3_FIMGI|nr:DUF503 domain-containing protein [Fimbriimonas ginsengisoli]